MCGKPSNTSAIGIHKRQAPRNRPFQAVIPFAVNDRYG
jgi:hypothetical protein